MMGYWCYTWLVCHSEKWLILDASRRLGCLEYMIPSDDVYYWYMYTKVMHVRHSVLVASTLALVIHAGHGLRVIVFVNIFLYRRSWWQVAHIYGYIVIKWISGDMNRVY